MTFVAIVAHVGNKEQIKVSIPPEIPEIFYFWWRALLVIVFLSFLSLLNCGQVVQYEKMRIGISIKFERYAYGSVTYDAEYLKILSIT